MLQQSIFTVENELWRRWFATDEFLKNTSPKMNNLIKFRNLKINPLALARNLNRKSSRDEQARMKNRLE